MSQYILRLDDASDYMDVEKWQRMEALLDRYEIKPLVGIIPDNRDSSLTESYKQDLEFWDKTARWKAKGWELALHGCYHKYTTEEDGINPVNKRSEFAGVSLDKQKEMIRHGVDVLKDHGIELVVLAGFLSVLGPSVIAAYPNRILNIHPSLIPSFCGPGYYGLKVHEEALKRGVKVTGATVHFVNEVCDGGPILLQKAVEVQPGDTPEVLQKRVMVEAEWKLLPQAIAMVCNGEA